MKTTYMPPNTLVEGEPLKLICKCGRVVITKCAEYNCPDCGTHLIECDTKPTYCSVHDYADEFNKKS